MANLMTSGIKMKNVLKAGTIASLLIVWSSQTIAGGGWPQPKGKGYFKLAEWWVSADQHYTSSGRKDPNVTSGLYNTLLYAEYGFTDRITGILNVPLFSRSVTNNLISSTTQTVISEGAAINTLGDVDISLKYGLINNGRVALSASLMLGIPAGEDAGGVERNLQTGDGEFNQMLRIDAGFPLAGTESFSLYANAYGGFNNRTNGFSDEVRFGAEVGIGVMKQKLWLVGRFDAIESRNNEPSLRAEAASFFASNSEVQSLTGELSYLITDKFGVSAAVATAISGKIVYAAPSYSIGVFVKM